MAKKFVRGITDIKTISNQDFDTNNVNDLLSDGQNNYIHRKKGNTEEYHNLTNNIKTIQSDNTDLLTVTNYNNTTNSATIRPKHDSQKEQLLESTNSTILISHGENGTDETTTVDVNPEKVLEHDNLLTGYGIEKTFSNNTTTLNLRPTLVKNFDVNSYFKGKIWGQNLTNAPTEGFYIYENEMYSFTRGTFITQTATKLKLSEDSHNVKYMRVCDNDVWGEWIKQVTDEEPIDKFPLALELFENIAVIGDSYSSGAVFTSATQGEEYYNISWTQLLARKHGLNAVNYSKGGLQTRTWLTSQYGLSKMQADTPKDLYFIFLGINDANVLSDNEIGTVSDIGTNADTFFGNYGKIINHVKTKAPNAKIVLINHFIQNRKVYTPIKQIGQHLNLPVLDLAKDPVTGSPEFLADMENGHPKSLGYASLAGSIERLLKQSFNNDKSYWIDYVPQTTE